MSAGMATHLNLQEEERCEIPAGTPVHSMGTGRWHLSRRKQTVYPYSVKTYGPWTVATWPGQGGYWRRVVLYDGRPIDRWPFDGKPTWDKIDSLGAVA